MRITEACLIGCLVTTHVCVGQVGSQPQAEAPKSPPWVRVAEKAGFSRRDTAEDVVVGGNMWPLMNDVWRLTLPEGTESGKP